MHTRHISDFSPEFEGSPLDYRCDDCSYTSGLDAWSSMLELQPQRHVDGRTLEMLTAVQGMRNHV